MLTSIIAAVLRLHTIVIKIVLTIRKALKAYEGYVGCIYNNEKVFVTSPNMKSLPNLLIDDVAPCQPSSDPKVRAYLYGEAAMMWHIAQCVGLELDARITWVLHMEPTFTKVMAWKVPAMFSVVGTLTDWLNVAENCYHSLLKS
ncbi:hypothetical protein BDP27DRAFT_1368729 [Rhodocollybia butyracea]|uniref:Uncharacterized protein n=1 Tax=Rhodocollybia butyracea TaxID=206335 RepID=A0A9P5PG02_9AGAR|nr:hypothetical protein BDP27DRAFT_1368729 [Rhodocollybia butyracea]